MKKAISLLLAGAISLSMAIPTMATAEESVKIFVAPYGNDYNTGLLRTAAVKTPAKAQQRAREYAEAKKTTEIIFAEGVYQLDTTLTLTEADSGSSADAPVIWRAETGAEVAFTRGNELCADDFTAYDSNIYTVDLSQFLSSGETLTDPLIPTIYQGGEMADIGKTENILITDDDGNLKGEIPNGRNWTKNDMVWEAQPNGYTYSYSDVKITDGELSVTGYGYMMNVLEEVDEPGEYYIDIEAKTLYLYPEFDIDTEPVYVAVAGNTRTTNSKSGYDMIKLTGTEHIRFENIDFFCGTEKGFVISGADDVVIYNADIKGLGRIAVDASNTSNLVIAQADIGDLKSGGITIGGGDQYTLTSSNNVIRNSKIHDLGRMYKADLVYSHAKGINATGVGVTISHNEIYNMPNSAVVFSGNDHVIEYNKIYDVILNVWDAGAIYGGRSWTDIGTKINNNYIFRTKAALTSYDSIWLEARNEIAGTDTDQVAIYLDDLQSHITVEDNIIYNMSMAAMFGGGSYNTFRNNVVLDTRSGLFYDERGLGWGNRHLDMAYDQYQGQIYEKLKELTGEVIGTAPEEPTLAEPVAPTAPAEDADQTVLDQYELDLAQYNTDKKAYDSAWTTYNSQRNTWDAYVAKMAVNAEKWAENKDMWIEHYTGFGDMLQRVADFDEATSSEEQDYEYILALRAAGTDEAEAELAEIYAVRTPLLKTLCQPYGVTIENNYHSSIWADWAANDWAPEGAEGREQDEIWTVTMPNGKVTEWQYSPQYVEAYSRLSPYHVGPDVRTDMTYYQYVEPHNYIWTETKIYINDYDEYLRVNREDTDGMGAEIVDNGQSISFTYNLNGAISTSDGIGIATDTYQAASSDTNDYVNDSYAFDTIVAIYDNDSKLVDVQIQDDVYVYDGQNIEVKFDIPENAETGWNVKVMLWNSIVGMKPVSTRTLEVN